MKAKAVFVTALFLAVVSSGAALAGKGPGGGGAAGGMGAQHRSMQGELSSGPGKAEQHRSERAIRRDRDREQYRGPDGERDKQKAKAKR